jgi:hypothetical protein
VTTTILAKSAFARIHLKGHADTPDHWRALLTTHGHSDVYVVDNKLPPAPPPAGTPIPDPA